MEVSTIHKTTLQVLPLQGLQMLSDHFLILGCAVLFEMYLLSSCSQTPPTIPRPKPEKCLSCIPKRKRLPTANHFPADVMRSGFYNSCINGWLIEETSDFVKQLAIFGTASNWRFQWSPGASGAAAKYEEKEPWGAHRGTKHCLYPAERMEGLEFWKGAWL